VQSAVSTNRFIFGGAKFENVILAARRRKLFWLFNSILLVAQLHPKEVF